MTYTPLPTPSVVDQMERVKRSGHKRWRDEKGRLYEHDPLHGDLEVYTKRGHHLGSMDPVTGEFSRPAEKGRTVDV